MGSTTSASPEIKLQQLRARLEQRLRELREGPQSVPPTPPPRYDEIFARGQQWLDELATEPDSHEEVEP